MPNRVLRDWTTSEIMDRLSAEAEVFFTRLIMKADDYGSFHGNAMLLKAALFPLKEYSVSDIRVWLNECVDAGLIIQYQAEGRDYVQIRNFGQRLRAMRNIFPQPADNSLTSGGQPADNGRPETKRNETESEGETETSVNPLAEEVFVETLQKMFPNCNLEQAWAKCYNYHIHKPNPPDHLWQWKQKFQTWLDIENKNNGAARAKTRDISKL